MGIFDRLIDILNGAEVASASYKPSKPYTGKLPNKVVRRGSKGGDVKAVQTFLNWCIGSKLKESGLCGKGTVKQIKKYQKKYGLKTDGIFGAKSKAKAKKIIEQYEPKKKDEPKKKEEPKKSERDQLIDKMMTACEKQSICMKNSKYKFEEHPTVEKSKKFGTCVTYVACVLQRIGILKSGQYIWQNGSGYGTGKVYGNNSKMTVTYMGNKTLKSLKDKLKKGDIILLDDNKSGRKGNGGHIFVLTGKWTDKGNPYIWDNVTAQRGKQKAYAYNGNRKVLARIRLK